MTQEYLQKQPHWAESLEVGDRVFATLRHPTDGKQNKHNVRTIVIGVHYGCISGNTEFGVYQIPFNELYQSEKP
jgi:hypothetical protein